MDQLTPDRIRSHICAANVAAQWSNVKFPIPDYAGKLSSFRSKTAGMIDKPHLTEAKAEAF
jgi:hypothetical protein